VSALSEKQNLITVKTNVCKMMYQKDFSTSETFLLDILQWFPENQNAIHNDRNILKVVDLGGRLTVVKSFKTPHLPSRWIYTFFRSSKAKRSFENSLTLKEKGFNVPEPVAFLEFFNHGLLKESFYISEKVTFDCTLHEVVRGQKYSWVEILPLVVEQAYRMHQCGIVHLDFSYGNVLVRELNNGFGFSLVDLNRLYKGEVSLQRGLKSLVRLIESQESLYLIAEKYAQCSQEDPDVLRSILSEHYERHLRQKRVKSRLKSFMGIGKK
jgi:tRNA A-37 threonylcarbamoyl transferase component Bud32